MWSKKRKKKRNLLKYVYIYIWDAYIKKINIIRNEYPFMGNWWGNNTILNKYMYVFI